MSEGRGARILADVELRSKVCDAQGLEVHTGRTAADLDVTVVILPLDANPHQNAAFARILKLGGATGLNVEHRDGRVIVATPCSTGSIAHLPSLGWKLAKRLEVFRDIVRLVSNCHQKRSAVGSLDPEYIFLDEDLRPFMLGPGVAPTTPTYCAPETLNTGKVSIASDVFALGKLLYFVVAEAPPTEAEEDPPRLDELATFPAGLSRIIRKATLRTPEARYVSLEALVEDLSIYGRYEEVGLAHPDADEQNLSGLSVAPLQTSIPSGSPRVSAPTPVPARTFEEWSPVKLGKAARIRTLIAGCLGAAASVVLAYQLGNAEWTLAMMMLFAGLAGFALINPGAESESRLRPALAFLFAIAAVTFVPIESLAKSGQQRKLNSGDIQDRVRTFRELLRERRTVFANLDLSGAELVDERFSFLQFSNVSFANADLRDTRFINARLDQVKFGGAKLEGTWLLIDSLDGAVGLETASCDSATRLPKQWSCTGGHLEKDAQALRPADAVESPLPVWGTPAR